MPEARPVRIALKRPSEAGPSPTRPRRRPRRLLLAIVAVAIAALLIALLAAHFLLSASPGPANPTQHSQPLVYTANQTLGPGTQNAIVVPFQIPSGATNAQITGAVNVTGCGPGYTYCAVYAAIGTPQDWATVQAGRGDQWIWCSNSPFGSCTPEKNDTISSGDISTFAGQPLDLCLWAGGGITYTEYVQSQATLDYTN
jgi:hypothetical protein